MKELILTNLDAVVYLLFAVDIAIIVGLIWNWLERKYCSTQRKDDKRKGKIGVGIFRSICLLILFFICVIVYLKNNADAFFRTASSTISAMEMELLDMQATTLTITSLVVTLASIIIAILTIYRDRRNEYNQSIIDESLRKLNAAEKTIRGISNIIAIQFVGESHRECYYDTIKQYIEEARDDEDDAFYNHFRMALISITDYIANDKHHTAKSTADYDLIIKTADEIIKSNKNDKLDLRFAYLECLHALYQKIKFVIQNNPKDAEEDINKAMRYLKCVAATVDDTFGHIANLYTLITLWSGIAKARIHETKEARKLLERSLGYSDEAIEKNHEKVEFLNHRVVICHQLYEISNENKYLETAYELYEKIIYLDEYYYKGYLNYAGTILLEVRNKMGLQSPSKYPDYSTYMPVLSNDNYDEILNRINDAVSLLDKALKIAPTFVNCHYKYGEALTLKILLMKILKRQGTGTETLINQVELCKKRFMRAHEISRDVLGCLYDEYVFLKLIKDDKSAQGIKDRIVAQLNSVPSP